MLSPVPSDQSIGRKWQSWGVGITLGEGYSKKFDTGRLPQVPTPYTFIFHFLAERYTLHLLVITNEMLELETILKFGGSIIKPLYYGNQWGRAKCLQSVCPS